MPAHAGQDRGRRRRLLDPRFRGGDKVETVMPAHAGIQDGGGGLWTPAFAGVTNGN